MGEVRNVVARHYQRAALEHTIERNTILSLPTGTGKTLVAVLAVDYFLRVHPDLAVVFIAPTVVLVSQQASYLRRYCASGPKVVELVGLEMDFWTQASWDSCMEKFNCLVGTPEVIRRALTVMRYLQPSRFSLVVFDECHNAVGNSPMVSIMREGLWRAPSCPRVLGLTASFAAGNISKPTPSLLQRRDHLEAIFQASMISPDVSGDSKGQQNEMEFVQVSYTNDVAGLARRSEVIEALVELLSLAGHLQKHLHNAANSLAEIVEELGKQALLDNCNEGGCLLGDVAADMQTKKYLAYQREELTEKLQDVPVRSNKLIKLLTLLRGELSGRRGIVFVQQTVLVQPLTKLLNSELGTPTSPMCVSVMGISCMTKAEQKASMRMFREDKVKLLVSTPATEEGIDVCDCEYVVRYNQFHTTKSHIQGSGRARMQGAKVYYFANDPTREQALADKMALVAGDNSLAMAEAEMRKRKAEHLARMEFDSVHPYRHHSNEINLFNSLNLVIDYCRRHSPNIKSVDCFALQAGTHTQGCQCIQRFDYPTPEGAWRSVHIGEVDKHWGEISVSDIFSKAMFPKMKGADKCKRRFLYVVAIDLVKQGLLDEHNRPAPRNPSRSPEGRKRQSKILKTFSPEAFTKVDLTTSEGLNMAKNLLRHWCSTDGRQLIASFRCKNHGKSHLQEFVSTCTVVGPDEDTRRAFKSGRCSSRKQAEKCAARAAIIGLGVLPGVTDNSNNAAPPNGASGVNFESNAAAAADPHAVFEAGSKVTDGATSETELLRKGSSQAPEKMRHPRQPAAAEPLRCLQMDLEEGAGDSANDAARTSNHADQVCATLHLHVFVGVEGTGLGARVSGEVQVAEPDWEEDHVFPPQTFGVLTARRLPLLPDIALHTRKSRCTIKLFQVQHAGSVDLTTKQVLVLQKHHEWLQRSLAFIGGWHHADVPKPVEERGDTRQRQWCLWVPLLPAGEISKAAHAVAVNRDSFASHPFSSSESESQSLSLLDSPSDSVSDAPPQSWVIDWAALQHPASPWMDPVPLPLHSAVEHEPASASPPEGLEAPAGVHTGTPAGRPAGADEDDDEAFEDAEEDFPNPGGGVVEIPDDALIKKTNQETSNAPQEPMACSGGGGAAGGEAARGRDEGTVPNTADADGDVEMECEAPEQTAEHDPSKRVMYLKSRTTKLAIDFGPVLHDEPLVPGVLMRVGMQRLPYAYRAASATTLTAPCEDAKSKGFDTYYSLYKNKYGLEYEPEGLLVEANFMGLNTKNLLLPNLLGKKLNRTTRKSRVRFPLQACKRLALKAGLWRGAILLPSLTWRLESLLLAEELTSHVLAVTSPSAGPAHNAAQRKTLVEKLLAAITHPACCEDVDYQQLEILGDSYLKYSLSVDLYLHHPEHLEGLLSMARTNLTSNHALKKYASKFPSSSEGAEIGLESYLRTFRLRCGLDANCTNCESDVCSKSLADCLEAVVGATFKVLGDAPTLRLVHAFGLVSQPVFDVRAYSARCLAAFQRNLLLHRGEEVEKVSGDVSRCLLEGWEESVVDCDAEARNPNVDALEAEGTGLGYRFKGMDSLMVSMGRSGRLALLDEALTHGSATSSQIHHILTHNNQRLEFLGDAVLDLVVVSYYSSLRVQAGSALTEGDISNMLHAITNNTNFAHLGLRLNLQNHLRMNCSRTKECIDEYVKAISADLQETGEEGASSARAQDNTAEASADSSSGDAFTRRNALSQDEVDRMWFGVGGSGLARTLQSPKVLADAFEALAGALFLDCGCSLDTVRGVMHALLIRSDSRIAKHPVQMLHEYCDFYGFDAPEYRQTGVPTPSSGTKQCRVEVWIHDKMIAHAVSTSPKKAKDLAASEALRVLLTPGFSRSHLVPSTKKDASQQLVLDDLMQIDLGQGSKEKDTSLIPDGPIQRSVEGLQQQDVYKSNELLEDKLTQRGRLQCVCF